MGKCRIIEDIVKEERKEAREEGRAEGRAEGREEGIAEGAAQQSLNTAIELIKMKMMTPEQIAKASNLPVKKVNELIDRYGG